MSNFLQDLKYGLRGLARLPVFTTVVVVTLALGIGANSAVFSILNGFFLRPFPYGDAGRLLRVFTFVPADGDDMNSLSYTEFLDLREQSKTLGRVSAFRPTDFHVSTGGEPERIEGGLVSAGLFETFDVPLVAGRLIQPEDDRPGAGRVVVLGAGLWKRRFGGDPKIIGQSVRLDGEPHEVIGIVPADFRFPIQGQLWTPLALVADPSERGNRFLGVAALPAPGVSHETVRTELGEIGKRLAQAYPESNKSVQLGIIPFRDFYVDRGRTVLYILQIAVLFVLLICCTNIANLLLARGASREREVAVRTAIGAGRLRLIRQFVVESLLLALMGGALGLVLARWGASALIAAIPVDLPAWIQVGVDSRVLWFTLIVSVVTGLLFGLVPAIRNSRAEVNDVLKDTTGGSRGGLRRQRLFKTIVVSEIAMTVVLLSCAGLMVKSFLEVQHVDPGLNPSSVLTVQVSDLPSQKYPSDQGVAAFYDQLLERLAAIQGVQAVGADSRLPLRPRGGSETGLEIEGMAPPGPDEESPYANYQVVTPDYFKTMQIALVQGRTFNRQDKSDTPPVVIVNSKLAERFWPGQDPIGKRIKISSGGEEWRTVAGVVANVKHRGLDEEPMFDVYAPHLQLPERGMTLVLRSALSPAALTSSVRSAVLEIDSDQPIFNVQTMNEVVGSSLWMQRFSAYLLFILAGLALLLAGIGLYGVMSYSIGQRSREIGIRMALGATSKQVLRLVFRQSLTMVGIGMLVGLPIALVLNRLLAGKLYGVGSMEFPLVLFVCLILVGVTLLASLLPARRTTLIHPAVVLRAD